MLTKALALGTLFSHLGFRALRSLPVKGGRLHDIPLREGHTLHLLPLTLTQSYVVPCPTVVSMIGSMSYFRSHP